MTFFGGLEFLLGIGLAILVSHSLPHSAASYPRHIRALAQDARHAWNAESMAHRLAWLTVVGIGVAVRLYHLGQPIRYDEAWTYLHYTSQPISVALSDYSVPNNHVFHSLLVWVTTRVFGAAPWAIRVPVFVFGCGVVVAAYVAARRLAGGGAAILTAALVAASPILVLYSTNARGYMFLSLAFLVLLLLGTAIISDDRPELWIPFGLVAAVGAYTAPVMFYPAGAITSWVVVEKLMTGGVPAVRAAIPRILAATMVGSAVVLAAYEPVITRFGASSLMSNRFVTALTWREFADALPPFMWSLRETLALGITPEVAVGLAIAFFASFFMRGPMRRARLTLALSCAVWCTLVILATRRPPPARVLLFLVPLFCIYAGVGMAFIAQTIAHGIRRREAVVCAVAACLLATTLGVHTIARRVVLASDETDWYGLREAPEVAKWLLAEFRPGDKLIVLGTGTPLDYYLRTMGGRSLSTFTDASGALRVLVVVNEGHGQTTESVLRRQSDVSYGALAAPVALWRVGAATVYAMPGRDSSSLASLGPPRSNNVR